MDGWCGRDASWDCVNASDGARWCAVEKDGQDLDGWMDGVEDMPVGNASDGARWCAVEKDGQDLYGWMVWKRCQLGLRQCIRRC